MTAVGAALRSAASEESADASRYSRDDRTSEIAFIAVIILATAAVLVLYAV
jgi:hypothetical protein